MVNSRALSLWLFQQLQLLPFDGCIFPFRHWKFHASKEYCDLSGKVPDWRSLEILPMLRNLHGIYWGILGDVAYFDAKLPDISPTLLSRHWMDKIWTKHGQWSISWNRMDKHGPNQSRWKCVGSQRVKRFIVEIFFNETSSYGCVSHHILVVVLFKRLPPFSVHE